MSWELRVRKKAGKQLGKFPKKDKLRISEVLREISQNPYSGDLEKIGGEENTWRRRAGNYRILFEIEVRTKTVHVRDIDRKTTTTYRKR